ncbi:NAD(+) diphosphatase [Saccharomonospora sp.]|uniref:NAD(+) diphosphatase n=1 Tax=Saccharomonospora sp. TaxID=33913 RepID=UPI00261F577A|nr:NAD(+) diphosphatase [Saccharomonospora sp.]
MSSAAPFELDASPALSRSTADRQESLRADPERLRARWPSARVVRMDDRGRVPVPERAFFGALDTGGAADSADSVDRADSVDTGGEAGAVPLSTTPAFDVSPELPDDAVFLGEWEDTDYWAVFDASASGARTVRVDSGWNAPVEIPVADGEAWVGLRVHGSVLDDTAAGLLTTAVALRNWHRRARHCARCGGPTRLRQFGWATICEQCGHEEYPRTDPAVICLVHDDIGVNGEHVLLARQPVWPAGRYSVLAGFVEAGESLESCVEREIREEVGVAVRDIRYLGSQPWPFPRSIMLGFAARAERGARLAPAEGEIEDARWVSRDRVRAAFEEHDPGLLLPGGTSIAHVMLRSWAKAAN